MDKEAKREYKNISLDLETYDFITHIRDSLPKKGGKKPSINDAVKYLRDNRKDIYGLVEDNFKDLNNILRVYYKGNADRAHISIQLKDVMIKIIKQPSKYENISEAFVEIMEY